MKKKYFYHSFDSWLKKTYGQKVQKISLDAGASCPNRDGKISFGGCTFCNARGSGSGLLERGLDLTKQWEFWKEQFAKSDRLKHTKLFLAYFQSFSNTYGNVERLKSLTSQLKNLDGIAGLSLGTRPDCIDDEKLSVLSELGLSNTWLEYGIQSMHDETLSRIKRGHDVKCSIDAILKTREHNINVCVHLMAGLPGEQENDFLKTVEKVCELPIQGIKLHGLYVCKNTALAEDFLNGNYIALEKNAYVELIAKALSIIPSNIIIHRLSADPGQDELLAPYWAAHKGHIVAQIDEFMQIEGLWQGCKNDVPHSNPYKG